MIQMIIETKDFDVCETHIHHSLWSDIYSCSTVDENEMQIFSNGIKVASHH